jgi:hypothetical protein
MERIVRRLDPSRGQGRFEVQRDIGGYHSTIRGFVVGGVSKIGTACSP